MKGFTTLPGDVSRRVCRMALVAGLLTSGAVQADEMPGTVQFSSGFAETSSNKSSSADLSGPTFECSPDWASGGPSSYPSSLPQADPASPLPAPYHYRSGPIHSGGAPGGFQPGCLAPAIPPVTVVPYMIGDFFGAIPSEPVILPGPVVNQAIYFQPTPTLGGPELVDYYRSVSQIDPMNNPGAFQTDPTVYVAGTNSQLVSTVPDLVPPQLLQSYDDVNGFAGNPVFITGGPDPVDPTIIIPPAPQNPGSFIALDAGENAASVDVGTAEGPAVLLNRPLLNIYEALLVYVPTPGSGGGVGRQKIAENSSPIPRDRVFLNGGVFTGVPLSTDGISVYRLTPGIEKAFYHQRASLEVRLPFASTINPNISANTGPRQNSTQFGNVITTLKALVRQTSNSALSVGVSVTAPTAKDVNIAVGGSPFLSIRNQSMHVMPFIGGANYNGRMFSQWYLQGDLDTTGSPVAIRNVSTGLIESAGKLNDAPMLYASVSGGYWIYKKGNAAVSFNSLPGKTIKRTVYTGGGGITGLAPIMEFHFNRSLDKNGAITSGPIELRSAGDVSLTNLVLGGVMTFGTGGSLTVAWGTPIIGQDDRQFDNAVRAMFNYTY